MEADDAGSDGEAWPATWQTGSVGPKSLTSMSFPEQPMVGAWSGRILDCIPEGCCMDTCSNAPGTLGPPVSYAEDCDLG